MPHLNKADQRQALRKQLVHGDISKIAELANVDTETVSRYFKNESDNAEVEKYTTTLLDARNKQRKAAVENALK
tara:strand:+ start:934 stop:1155 length:222 start_codon:yes stop_codon:yes gene_type:complete